jgi:hypothetical protein
MAALPRRMARWVTAGAVAAAALGPTGAWRTSPELALAACIGVGAAAAGPRVAWAAPLIAAGTLLVGALFEAQEWPTVLGAGAAAGALAAAFLPERTDGLDWLNAGLGTLIGSTMGLFVAERVPFPAGSPGALEIGTWAVLALLLGSAGLLPVAWRHDYLPAVPTRAEIAVALPVPYREPALAALDIYQRAHGPSDPATRRGLAEVTRWVFRLQTDLLTLDRELAGIDPDAIQVRIADAEKPVGDDFTRERKQATAAHLRRLLDHRVIIATERGRTDALSVYALAFLEEARAGIAVARALPGEAVPDRLPEVLQRLRTQATAGEARRRTAREIGVLG